MNHEERRLGRHRVVEVYTSGSSYGSGYGVGDDLVLTARHVVSGGTNCGVRLQREPDWRPAKVVWSARGFDAALLRVPSAPWRDEPDSGAARWGRVGGGAAPVPVTATGFPQAQEVNGGGREPENLRGTIDTATTLLSGRYSVDVTSARPVPPGPGLSGWRGMSGAVLLGPARQLLGVLVEDATAFGGRRLEAAPATWLLDDPVFADLVGAYPHDIEDVLPRSTAVLDDPEWAFLTDAYQPLPKPHGDYHLFKPRHRGVPFLGRETELDQLRAWWRSPDLVSVAIVVGDGGAGKTRLAAQLCEEAARSGWSAGFADTVALSAPRTAVIDLTWPTLLVVDYVDQASKGVGELVARLSRRGRGPRLRVLLLARTPADDRLTDAWWWQELNFRAEDAVALRTRATVRLRAGGLGEADRLLHAREAVRAFGGDPDQVALPDLADDGFRNPLKVHLAALLALRGEYVGADAVMRTFVRREIERWGGRLTHHGVASLGDEGLRQAAALVVLAAPTRAETVGLLTALPSQADPGGLRIADRERVARWLAEIFHGGRRLAPLAPDLLAEQLLTETRDLSGIVLGIVDHPDLVAAHLERLLDALTLGAGRPEIGAVLRTVLGERLDVFLDAAVAAPAASQLPERLSTALVRGTALDADAVGAAAARIRDRRRGGDDPAGRLRGRLADLAVDWYAAHPSSEEGGALADAAAHRAVGGDLARATAAARRARHIAAGSTLAAYNLGTCLAMTGAVDDAIPLLEQAAGDPDLRADALVNLTTALVAAGRQVAATHAFLRAVRASPGSGWAAEVARLLGDLTAATDDTAGARPAAPGPAAYRPPHGIDSSWRQAPPRAVDLLERLAAQLCRGCAALLPEADRSAVIPFLFSGAARTQARRAAYNYSEYLRMLGQQLAAQGLHEDAIVPAAESVRLLQRFGTREQWQHRELARNLSQLGNYCHLAGRYEEAARYQRDAVGVYRMLLPDDPAALTVGEQAGLRLPAPGPGLANALEMLSESLWNAGELEEAAQAQAEALTLHEVMGDDARAAAAAYHLGNNQVLLGRDEAVTTLRRAVDLFEELAATEPDQLPGLVDALLALAGRAGDTGADGAQLALAAGARAIEISHDLTARHPQHLPTLVDALLSHSVTLLFGGESAAAAERAGQAVVLCRESAADDAQLAFGLSLVAQSALVLGRQTQAMAVAREAAEVLADVPDTNIEVRLSRVTAFTTLATMLLMTGQPAQALDLARAADSVVSSMADLDVTGLDVVRMEVLTVLGGSLLELGDPTGALAAVQGAREDLGSGAGGVPALLVLARACLVEAKALVLLERPAQALSATDVAEQILSGDEVPVTVGALLAGVLVVKAACLLDTGEPAAGLVDLDRSVALYHGPVGELPGQQAELIRTLGLRARAHILLDQVDEALADGQEATARYRAAPAEIPAELAAGALSNAGVAASALERHAEALAFFEEAVALFDGIASDATEGSDARSTARLLPVAESYIGLTEARMAVGNLAGALEATAAGARLLTDRPALSGALGVLLLLRSRCLLTTGEPYLASAQAAEALLRDAPAQLPPIRLYRAHALTMIAAGLADEEADAQEALPIALEAIELFREFPDNPPATAASAHLLRITDAAAQGGRCQVTRDSRLLVDRLWDWLVDPYDVG